MKYFFLFLFAIISNFLIAQRDMKPGYIITNEGDTVFGQVDYQGDAYNAGTCYFIKSGSDEPKKYLPGEIKSYRIIDGKYYVSRKVTIENKEREVFLEFLVNGKADIYYYPAKYYFIEKEDKEIHILENTEKEIYVKDSKFIKKNREYIGVLGAYMNDCPSLSNKISNSMLDQGNLIKLVTEYHNLTCSGEECIVYSKKPPKVSLKVGLSAGYNMSWVTLEESNANMELNDKDGVIVTGVQFDISNTGSHERFFFSLGFCYATVNHHYNIVHLYRDINYGIQTIDLEIEYSSKNFMLYPSINYIYRKYKLKPFIGLGGMLYITPNKIIDSSPKFYKYNTGTKSFGPLFIAGVSANISRRSSLKIEANYHYGIFSTSKDFYYSSSTNNLNFLLTFQYKLTKN